MTAPLCIVQAPLNMPNRWPHVFHVWEGDTVLIKVKSGQKQKVAKTSSLERIRRHGGWHPLVSWWERLPLWTSGPEHTAFSLHALDVTVQVVWRDWRAAAGSHWLWSFPSSKNGNVIKQTTTTTMLSLTQNSIRREKHLGHCQEKQNRAGPCFYEHDQWIVFPLKGNWLRDGGWVFCEAELNNPPTPCSWQDHLSRVTRNDPMILKIGKSTWREKQILRKGKKCVKPEQIGQNLTFCLSLSSSPAVLTNPPLLIFKWVMVWQCPVF